MPHIRTMFQDIKENFLFKYVDFYSAIAKQKTARFDYGVYYETDFKPLMDHTLL